MVLPVEAAALAGQGVDRPISYPLAFCGLWNKKAPLVLATQWALKAGWEALLTPATYAAVGWLKCRESADIYDEGTDFTPLRARV